MSTSINVTENKDSTKDFSGWYVAQYTVDHTLKGYVEGPCPRDQLSILKSHFLKTYPPDAKAGTYYTLEYLELNVKEQLSAKEILAEHTVREEPLSTGDQFMLQVLKHRHTFLTCKDQAKAAGWQFTCAAGGTYWVELPKGDPRLSGARGYEPVRLTIDGVRYVITKHFFDDFKFKL